MFLTHVVCAQVFAARRGSRQMITHGVRGAGVLGIDVLDQGRLDRVDLNAEVVRRGAVKSCAGDSAYTEVL